MDSYWLRARVHPTWHFTVLCAGFIFGVAIAKELNCFGGIAWLILSVGLIASAYWRQRRMWLIAAIVGGMLLGLWRGSLDQRQLSAYQSLYGKHVVATGTVAGDPDANRPGRMAMQLRSISINNHLIGGEVWVSISTPSDIRRGDTITVDGELQEGFGNFAASMNSAKLLRAYREEMGDIAVNVRDDFAQKIRLGIDEPYASLGVGYLLGQKSVLPSSLQDALVISGLTHIVVASGYNLTILVRLARRLFAKISKYLAVLSSGTLIVGFIAITGLSPSMSRAGFVAALGLWAWYYGRKFHPVTLLLFAAAATVMINPAYAWGNLGWALSFAAFAGVMIVAPLIQAYFYGNHKPSFITQLLGESFSAQLVTAPIILYAFGTFSNVALVSNLLILPFIPLAMLLTFVAGIAGYVIPSLASILAWPAQVVLTAMVKVIEWSAGLSWAQSEWHISWWQALAWYVAVTMVCIWIWKTTRYHLRNASLVE